MTGRLLCAVVLPPGPALLDALRAALDGGPALLPISPDLPVGLREGLLATLRPHRLVTAAGTVALADPEPLDADVALVVATSGSTGRPKGVQLSAAALRASATASLSRLAAGPGDRWLCCLPADHVAGVQVLVRAVVGGTEPVVHPRFEPAAVAGADAEWVSLVPTMLHRLLVAGVDLGRWTGILLGGAAPPRSLVAAARAAGARVVTTYGMSETAGGCVYDGSPLDGVQVRVGPDDRIGIRGPVLCSGYRLAPSPVVDGWLRTGDLGRWTPDGRLAVLGRVDDVITTGGESVAPATVATVLGGHPGVAEVAVLGRPDPQWGERVVAVVVPAPGARPPTLAELRAYAAAELPRGALPRELEIVDRLPLLPGGKVDRLALRDR